MGSIILCSCIADIQQTTVMSSVVLRGPVAVPVMRPHVATAWTQHSVPASLMTQGLVTARWCLLATRRCLLPTDSHRQKNRPAATCLHSPFHLLRPPKTQFGWSAGRCCPLLSKHLVSSPLVILIYILITSLWFKNVIFIFQITFCCQPIFHEFYQTCTAGNHGKGIFA